MKPLDLHRCGSPQAKQALGLGLLASLVLIPFCSPAPALAHHVADLSAMQPTVLNGILSGLAHPVLGPDHLLFLLALSLVGLQRRLRWALGLLVVGLLGSASGLLWPGLPGAEILVAITLVVEALVLLRRLPALTLLPAMALHGYVLSGPVFGWSTMPITAYGLGLLLLLVCGGALVSGTKINGVLLPKVQKFVVEPILDWHDVCNCCLPVQLVASGALTVLPINIIIERSLDNGSNYSEYIC